MARESNQDAPIGAKGHSPLVVLTADISRFLHRHLEKGPNGRPTYDKVVARIKTCKEQGRVLTGVSYDTLKRIYNVDGIVTADTIAEAILISEGGSDMLGKDIPLYRNPFLAEWKYVDVMRTALRRRWDKELDGPWDEQAQKEYIQKFPSITPP